MQIKPVWMVVPLAVIVIGITILVDELRNEHNLKHKGGGVFTCACIDSIEGEMRRKKVRFRYVVNNKTYFITENYIENDTTLNSLKLGRCLQVEYLPSDAAVGILHYDQTCQE